MAPIATIEPSVLRLTDHPELSSMASPSILVPTCCQIPELY